MKACGENNTVIDFSRAHEQAHKGVRIHDEDIREGARCNGRRTRRGAGQSSREAKENGTAAVEEQKRGHLPLTPHRTGPTSPHTPSWKAEGGGGGYGCGFAGDACICVCARSVSVFFVRSVPGAVPEVSGGSPSVWGAEASMAEETYDVDMEGFVAKRVGYYSQPCASSPALVWRPRTWSVAAKRLSLCVWRSGRPVLRGPRPAGGNECKSLHTMHFHTTTHAHPSLCFACLSPPRRWVS